MSVSHDRIMRYRADYVPRDADVFFDGSYYKINARGSVLTWRAGEWVLSGKTRNQVEGYITKVKLGKFSEIT